MADQWLDIFINDMQQYKNNLLLQKVSRGILILFMLGTFMPRDVRSFLTLLSHSAEALLTTSQFSSLITMLVFNSILSLSYLIQRKILPLSYHSNYMPGIFDSLSFSVARTVFFIITNWFILGQAQKLIHIDVFSVAIRTRSEEGE